MDINKTSAANATRQTNSLTRALSQASLEEQARPAKRATHAIASETLRNEQARQIIAYCNAIDRDATIIRVETRKALSTYLVNNQIQNPGFLNKTQQSLCAWTLLEHAARRDPGFEKIDPAMVSRYIPSNEKPRFKAIETSLPLDSKTYIT